VANERKVCFELTLDAASGAVDTGLSVITGVSIACKSAATAGFKVKANQNSAGTALNGSLFLSSAASGDVLYVTVFGR
jgi:hypothetical protein